MNWCELDRNVEESVAEVWCGSVQSVVSVALSEECGRSVEECEVWKVWRVCTSVAPESRVW